MPGCYFVTLCIKELACELGSVRDGRVTLTLAGRLTEQAWATLIQVHPFLRLDGSIVMPSHLHGVLWLRDPDKDERVSLSDIVGRYKSFTTRILNDTFGTPGRIWWQRGFHDRVIRTERELETIRNYIRENPERWTRKRKRTDG